MELTKRQREKIERKEVIISKAEELFCKHGFEKVSMDSLAKESEFTKRTIYRYFTCKEDLFFAVVLRGYVLFFDMIRSKGQEGNTGFEKIRFMYYAYYDFYCKFPELVQLINMSGIIKSSSAAMDVPHRDEFMALDKSIFEGLIKVFQEGKADGSIRSDLEISTLAFSSIYVVTGFFQLLSLSGATYTEHFALDKDKFVKFTIDMMVDFLKSKQ